VAWTRVRKNRRHTPQDLAVAAILIWIEFWLAKFVSRLNKSIIRIAQFPAPTPPGPFSKRARSRNSQMKNLSITLIP